MKPLYKNALDSILRAQKVPQASFLWEHSFLVDYYSQQIKNAIIKKYPQIEISSFYFEEYDAQQVYDILHQQSLFANANLVILKLNKIKDYEKPKKSQIARFLNALKQNPNNFLIIEFYKDDKDSSENDFRKNSRNDYKKIADSIGGLFVGDFVNIRFFAPNRSEALNILKNHAKEINLSITSDAIARLYELQNEQLEICLNELNKFCVFNDEITESKINSLSYGLYKNSIEEFCDSLFSGNKFFNILIKLEERGFNESDFIKEVQNYFYRLFLCFAYIKTNGEFKIDEILGYKPPQQIANKYQQFCMQLNEEKYFQIFHLLGAWQNLLRSGKQKEYFSNLIKLKAIVR